MIAGEIVAEILQSLPRVHYEISADRCACAASGYEIVKCGTGLWANNVIRWRTASDD